MSRFPERDEVRQERAEVDQDVQDGRAVQIAAALDVYDAEDDPGCGMGNDIDGLGQRRRVHMNHSEQDAGGGDRDPGPGIMPDKVDEEPSEEHLLDDGAHNAQDEAEKGDQAQRRQGAHGLGDGHGQVPPPAGVA